MKRILMLVLFVGGIMAGPVLADVVDHTTAVAEESMNQYKTAILLVAGAGWDSDTDMDLETVSDEVIVARGVAPSLDDRLSASLDTSGKIKTGAVAKQTMMALDSAAAATGDAVRHDEFTQEHTAAGAHRQDVALITKQAQVALDSAAAVNGDAVRFDEYSVHTHSGVNSFCLYMQHIESAATNTDAVALAGYNKTDANTTEMIAIRLGYYKKPSDDVLTLRGAYVVTGGAAAYIILKCGGLSATYTIPTAGGLDFEKELNISALADDATYEVRVVLQWSSAGGGGNFLSLWKPSIWVDAAAEPE